MDRYQGITAGSRADVATPLTDAARFTITKVDVGSEAVRAGIAAQIEQDRLVLLGAAKLALRRLRASGTPFDGVAESMLDNAIKVAELQK